MLRDDEPRSILRTAGRCPNQLQILAPTALEYWAVRCTLPTANITRTGIRLSRLATTTGEMAVICGMAGGLNRDLPPGAVVIPDQVGLPDGRIIDCDHRLVQALVAAARSLGFEPDAGPMLTAPTFVTGPDREYWSHRGFGAADMETGLLAEAGLRVATVRVILDSPSRDIAAGWMHPAHAVLQPTLWGEFLWLCRAAPLYSLRAARVLRAGLQVLGEERDA